METEKLKKELKHDANVNGILLLIFWAIYFLSAFASGFIAKPFAAGKDLDTIGSIVNLIFYILLYPIGFSLILFIYNKFMKSEGKESFKSCFSKPKMPASWVVRWIFIGVGTTYVSAYLSAIIFAIIEYLIGYDFSEVTFQSDGSTISNITTLIAVPIFAPFFEELYFRGTMFRNVKKYGPWSMIVLSGITFGLWHANYAQLVFASAMGIVSCFLVVKTESVIPSIIVHFIVNSIGCLQALITSNIDMDSLATDNISYVLKHPDVLASFAFIGALILGLLITWIILVIIEFSHYRNSFKIEKTCYELTTKQQVKIYLSSPAMSIAMLLMLTLTILRAMGIAL